MASDPRRLPAFARVLLWLRIRLPFALAAVVLLAAGGAAVLIPARRASLADPASVLRNE